MCFQCTPISEGRYAVRIHNNGKCITWKDSKIIKHNKSHTLSIVQKHTIQRYREIQSNSNIL